MDFYCPNYSIIIETENRIEDNQIIDLIDSFLNQFCRTCPCAYLGAPGEVLFAATKGLARILENKKRAILEKHAKIQENKKTW